MADVEGAVLVELETALDIYRWTTAPEPYAPTAESLWTPGVVLAVGEAEDSFDGGTAVRLTLRPNRQLREHLLSEDRGMLRCVLFWIMRRAGESEWAVVHQFEGGLSALTYSGGVLDASVEPIALPEQEAAYWSDGDQQRRSPGDRGFERAAALAEGIQIPWPPSPDDPAPTGPPLPVVSGEAPTPGPEPGPAPPENPREGEDGFVRIHPATGGEVGAALTATVFDADGVQDVVSWRWEFRATSGAAWSVVAGATTAVLVPGDVGEYRATADYRDSRSNDVHTATSPAVSVIASTNVPMFGTPRGLTAAAFRPGGKNDSRTLHVSWDVVPEVIRYEWQYQQFGSSSSFSRNVFGNPPPTTAMAEFLTAGQQYRARARAVRRNPDSGRIEFSEWTAWTDYVLMRYPRLVEWAAFPSPTFPRNDLARGRWGIHPEEARSQSVSVERSNGSFGTIYEDTGSGSPRTAGFDGIGQQPNLWLRVATTATWTIIRRSGLPAGVHPVGFQQVVDGGRSDYTLTIEG